MLRIKGKKYHVMVLVHSGVQITIRLYYGVECSRVSSLKKLRKYHTFFCKLKSNLIKSYGRRLRGDCINSEAAIEEEIADAMSEISGKKNFPCESCDKICTSKGGLMRHKNSKRGNRSTAVKIMYFHQIYH